MSEPNVDKISFFINQKLASLSDIPFEPYIFRVDDRLRRQNQKAYEPQILAIGPYHHGKDNVRMMEEQKLRFLQLLLKRRNESSVDRYVMAIAVFEERARKCYAESISLDKDEFVEMMLLDGCFIIELFRKFKMEKLRYIHEPIFHLDRMLKALQLDLMLFENQLPFFILVQLLNMTKVSSQEDIIGMALYFLGQRLPGPGISKSTRISVDNVDHLLGLIHHIWCSSFAEMVSNRNVINEENKLEFIKCTTELREAGIRFKKDERSTTLLDIKFKNGVMEVPPLTVNDDTESLFRNLIAYEQYHPNFDTRYVTDYTRFMDCLINCRKDAEKLRNYRIIENWLGDDEAASAMFNKLGVNAIINTRMFCYSEVFKNVNKHCARRRNIWLAKLRRNYFNSPWGVISFLAAVVLLLLTLIQTIFSVLSYGTR